MDDLISRKALPEFALAHMALGIGGCGVMLVTLFFLIARWWLVA